MIDRIRIYIGSFKYASTIRNLKFTYAGRQLKIAGSLHKYAKGNNYSLFTYEEAKNVLHELSDVIGIPLNRFVVTSMELGLNMQLDKDVVNYLHTIYSYKSNRFILMTPLKGTSRLKGCKCVFSEYSIKFYDKTFEAIKKGRIKREEVPANLLRYEIQLSRKQLKSLGFTNVTGNNLLSPLHYTRFKRLMKQIFDKIVFDDTVDYTGCLEDDIKKHIFVMSDKYGYYLQCLKDYFGETEYRRERRRTNELLKKMSSLPKGELETELKSKFETAISKI